MSHLSINFLPHNNAGMENKTQFVVEGRFCVLQLMLDTLAVGHRNGLQLKLISGLISKPSSSEVFSPPELGKFKTGQD